MDNIIINKENNNEWYDMSLPRVSNIVSFIYPFEWEDKKRYLEWLKKIWTTEEEYLWWANELWTFIHNQMENHILWKKIDKKNPLYLEVKEEIRNWIKYLNELIASWYKLLSEVYLIDWEKRYQWTSDLILIKENDIIIADFKSYWVVKKRYWLPNKDVIDKSKREKVRLQLSLYARAYLYHNPHYKCRSVKLIYIHSNLIREYDMEIIPKEEINIIIDRYLKSINNYYITF